MLDPQAEAKHRATGSVHTENMNAEKKINCFVIVLFRVAVLWAGLTWALGLDDDEKKHSLEFWVVVGTNLLKASFIISDF